MSRFLPRGNCLPLKKLPWTKSTYFSVSGKRLPLQLLGNHLLESIWKEVYQSTEFFRCRILSCILTAEGKSSAITFTSCKKYAKTKSARTLPRYLPKSSSIEVTANYILKRSWKKVCMSAAWHFFVDDFRSVLLCLLRCLPQETASH